MKRKNIPVLVVSLLIILIALLGMLVFMIQKYIPTKEKMNPSEYYGQMVDGEAAIILGTEIIEQRGLIEGEYAYLPLDIVNQYLNQRYYWDGEGQRILYATPSEITSENASTEPGNSVWLKNDQIYLSIDYIKRFTDIDAVVSTNPGRIAIQYQFNAVKTVIAKKNTYVRYLGGIKAKVLTQVSKGTELIALEEFENWMKVATYDGYIGFVEKKRITNVEEKIIERTFPQEEYNYISMQEPVNLVWHQVTNQDANAMLADSIVNMSGVNVISPTWFSVIDNAGNISDISSADYVAQAHERGLKVWGLIDNFNENMSTTTVLASTSARQNLINQVVNAAVNVGLDGINIDFEYLSEEVGVHFLQFLRELSIETHKYNLVLSVDNPVPEAFTSHYDRAEQGRVVDYVIIMGYDEHYVGSEQAGSVASLPWVEKGITDTLSEVPAQRVINAVPFYTRVWKIQAGTLSSEAIGMDRVQEVLAENAVETYWNTEVSQNYGAWENEGISYQVWIEDGQSIAEKVKLVPKYNLAGVAAWKLGFENSGIWQIINDNLK